MDSKEVMIMSVPNCGVAWTSITPLLGNSLYSSKINYDYLMNFSELVHDNATIYGNLC